MKIIHKIETYTSDGKPVLRFTVMNSSGAYMEFTNWGTLDYSFSTRCSGSISQYFDRL